jgi:hypothetical protein
MVHILTIVLLVFLIIFLMPVWWWSIAWGWGAMGGPTSILILVLLLRWKEVI